MLAAKQAAEVDLLTSGKFRAGRDPASLGMEGRLRWQQDQDKLAAAMRQWQDADATHLSVTPWAPA